MFQELGLFLSQYHSLELVLNEREREYVSVVEVCSNSPGSTLCLFFQVKGKERSTQNKDSPKTAAKSADAMGETRDVMLEKVELRVGIGASQK